MYKIIPILAYSNVDYVLMNKNREVDTFLTAQHHPLTPEIELVREIILQASPKITETIKWKTPTFMYKGNMASFFMNAKKHVSLMFHRGAAIPGDHPLLEGEGDTSRTAKFQGLDDVEARASELQAVIRAWIALREG